MNKNKIKKIQQQQQQQYRIISESKWVGYFIKLCTLLLHIRTLKRRVNPRAK